MIKQTKFFTVSGIAESSASLDEAAAIIRRGGLVAMPTETVYGLGADATNPDAVATIFVAKGRPQDNPLIVHIHSVEMLAQVAREIPPDAFTLAERFWPGPLTMILPKTDAIPSITSAGLDTVAIRLPAHPVARELIRRAGVPVAAPSANLSGSPSTTTAQHCLDDLDGRIDAIVDGGPCTVGVESTVLSLAEGPPRLLRPGAVTAEALSVLLPGLVLDEAVTSQPAPGARVASPGMKYKHYAPHCQVFLLEGPLERYPAWVNQQAAKESGVFALCCDEDLPLLDCPAVSLGPRENGAAQAARLFDCLRSLDEKGARTVYTHCPEKSGIGLALYNRLIRAAAFRTIQM